MILKVFIFFILYFALNISGYDIPGDEETDVDLLTPLENLINTDPRVYRTKGLDGLPAVGIQRGVEIVVPYRIYLPRKFFSNFAIVASIKPKDNQGGYLFAIVNAFDTVVDVGVLLSAHGRTQTNISLVYTDSQISSSSNVIASFLVPAFTNQWTQFALEVSGDNVALYFRCMRFATRRVKRQPSQLQMDDASKLYIANAGPIIGGGFEGAIQELKLHDDPAEASNQCNEDWWKGKRKNNNNSNHRKGDEASGFDEGFDTTTTTPRPSTRFTTPEEEDNRVGDDDDDRGQSAGIGFQPPTTTAQSYNSPLQNQLEVTATTLRPEFARGPKGDKGDPGPPGVCPSDCAGFYSISPSQQQQQQQQPYSKLSDEDIERIANHPSLKEIRDNRRTTALPEYNPRVHQYSSTKGQKGERGEPGPMGPPGQPGQPGASYPSSASSQQSGSGGGIVSVFPTSTELFASHRSIQEGQLAFSTSSQELYIRVRNGFKIVKLEGFMPTIDQRPPVTAPVDEYRPPPSVTQSYEPEIRTLAPPRRIEPPPREDIDYQLRLRHQQQQREQQIREQQQPHGYPQHQRHYSRANPQDKVLHLIALNAPVNGKMGGIRGADLQCYQHARQSGYRTTFRAFLSSNVQDLRDLVHYADNDTIVVNSRGEKLFDTWSHIFNPTTSPYNAPIYSFNQKNIFDEKQQWQDRYIWHGSDESGRRLEQNFCEFWRTNDQYAHGMASAVERGRPLITEAEPISCHRHLIVLCVENMSKYNVDVRLGQRKRRKY